jgi:hypothetical protein
MNQRGKWQGMWTIVRFNWPFYGSALIVLLLAVAGFGLFENLWMKASCGIAVMGAFYFLVGSLGVSHWVYDCSDLYQWQWLDRALAGINARRLAFCHSGFDEASQALCVRLPSMEWVVLDHYDPAILTEASIRRARKHHPPPDGTVRAAYDNWPVEPESVDGIFGLLAIHELRSEGEREAWFREAVRCLRPGGRIILAEHLRDSANFVAFGPGFLHFHSRASWQRCWRAAGLMAGDEFSITPWVRVFVLTRCSADD